MPSAIVCCSCSSVPDYCKKAVSAIHPGASAPPLYLSRKIGLFADSFPEESEVRITLTPFKNKRGRFGFYLAWDESGNIVEYWNLLKMKRIV